MTPRPQQADAGAKARIKLEKIEFLDKKLEKITHFLAELKLIFYLCNQKEHRRQVLRQQKTPWKQTGALSRQYF